jgi:hypothetical protein
MKSLTIPMAARGARALAGAAAALLLAAGGASAATPDHAWRHDGWSRGFHDGNHRRLRHHFPHRFHGRHEMRHIGVWNRSVR